MSHQLTFDGANIAKDAVLAQFRTLMASVTSKLHFLRSNGSIGSETQKNNVVGKGNKDYMMEINV